MLVYGHFYVVTYVGDSLYEDGLCEDGLYEDGLCEDTQTAIKKPTHYSWIGSQ